MLAGLNCYGLGHRRRNPEVAGPRQVRKFGSEADDVIGTGDRHAKAEVPLPRAQLLSKLLRHVPPPRHEGAGKFETIFVQ